MAPDRPLTIVAHNGAPVWGGAEVAIARLVTGLGRRGHDVMLYCNDAEVARRAAGLGAPTGLLHLGGDIALHDALRLALQLRRRNPDVLILGTFRKVWLGAVAARLGGVPRVVARIGLETDTPRNAKYRFVFRRWIDAVVFNADGMRRAFLAALPGYPGDAITIHTGIAPSSPGAGAAFRRELGVPQDAPLVGSVGRLATQKRYDRLVRALPSLRGVHAVVVGEGSERGTLEALAREEGVAERVHLPGHRDDVADALDAMDVFVLCSDREGMSNAMIEALAAGVPVVSTDVSGAREALAPVVSAPAVSHTVKVRVPGVVLASPDRLAPMLRELLGDRPRLVAMAAAARRVARQRFDEDRMLDAWERVLRGDD